MATFSKAQKEEILARMKAFNFSGFYVKVHGNVCYHHKSFVGRDYKAWSQMALCIISPYITEGQQKVLLALSKVVCACVYVCVVCVCTLFLCCVCGTCGINTLCRKLILVMHGFTVQVSQIQV